MLSLDCIIFGLQRFGGISNFWMRLIEATGCGDLPFTAELILPRKVITQALPELGGRRRRTEALPSRLTRYLSAHVSADAAIFHTPYYRRPDRRVDRYITSVHDFTYERHFSGLPRMVHHWQKRPSIESADLSVCVSEATRADLLSYFPKVSAASTCVVPLGVDRSRFYPQPGGHTGAPYVLFVGQRTGYKRFDIAVDAVSRVPGLTLAIVGPPLTDAETAQLHLTLLGRWVKHDSVGTDALRHLYTDAYAFIFPSDYEGFGLPILEAMACGCPTIAANRSSFPEVAGNAALLATDQAADAYADLLRQLESSALRGRLIAAGTARTELFTWERCFARLWDCYR